MKTKGILIAPLLALAMLLTFAACGDDSSQSAEKTDEVTVLQDASVDTGSTVQDDNESGRADDAPGEVDASASFDLEKYKSQVAECKNKIYDASVYLENVGKYEMNFWKARGEYSDAMVDSAFEWLSEKSSETRETVDSSYSEIRQQYKDIILTEIDGKEAADIDDVFRDMYDAYSSLYSIVTSPSGTLSTFTTELDECVSNIIEANDDISLFLE